MVKLEELPADPPVVRSPPAVVKMAEAEPQAKAQEEERVSETATKLEKLAVREEDKVAAKSSGKQSSQPPGENDDGEDYYSAGEEDEEAGQSTSKADGSEDGPTASASGTSQGERESASTTVVDGSGEGHTGSQSEWDVKLAESIKADGNAAFGRGEYAEAASHYSKALDMAPAGAKQRAVYFCNRAACMLQLGRETDAESDCTSALELDEVYMKAYNRRAVAREKLGQLEKALEDWQKVFSLDPKNSTAASSIRKLEPKVAEAQERQKEEMLGKLKELGNSVLGNFGLSLDNFQAVKDPSTGGYSISFQQST